MKKALVVLLAVALVFSFATSAFAFTDISAEKAATQSAINRFAAYGVLDGYPDGTFLPDGTITRAEFAKIVIVYTGNEVLADSLKNSTSSFSDVKTGEWYTGYINAAVALGYFQGMGDGTFGVAQPVTYGQVITVLLRLAGYTDALPGSWPFNYVSKASQSGIALVQKATAFDTYGPAIRKDVVLMAEKLLDVETVSYSEFTKSFIENSTSTGTPIIVSKAYAVFNNETPSTGGIKVTYDTTKKALMVYNQVMSKNFGASDGFALLDFVINPDMNGDVITNDDEEIVFVELDGKYVKGMAAYNSKTAVFTIDGVEYKTVADGSFDVTGGTPDYINAVAAADGKYVYATYDKANKQVKAIKVIGAQSTSNIVKKASANGKGFDFVGTNSGSVTTVAGKNEVFTVFKDGALATVDDIKVGDLVYVAPANTIANSTQTYIVTSPAGAAAISAITADVVAPATTASLQTYTVDGKKYDQAKSGLIKVVLGTENPESLTVENYTSTTNPLKDVEGVLYKDALGYPAYMVYGDMVVTTSKVTGVILDGTVTKKAGTGEGDSIGTGGSTYSGYSDLTVLTTEGETVTYSISKDVKFFVDANKIYVDVKGDTKKTGTTISGNSDDIQIKNHGFVTLTLDADGVVTAVADAAGITATSEKANGDSQNVFGKLSNDNKKYSTITFGAKNSNDVKTYSIAADTPVFVFTTKNGVESVKVADYSTLNLEGKAGEYKLNTKGTAVSYLSVRDYQAVEAVKTYAVLSELYYQGNQVLFADGTAYTRANTVTVTDKNNTATTAAKGDIVSYTLIDGKISALKVETAVGNITAAAAKKVYAVAGNVVSIVTSATGATTPTYTNYVLSDKLVVYIYNKPATTAGAVATFVEMGTVADVVAEADVIYVETSGVISQIIIVK